MSIDIDNLSINFKNMDKENLEVASYQYPIIHKVLQNITDVVTLDGALVTDGEVIDILYVYLKQLGYIKENK